MMLSQPFGRQQSPDGGSAVIPSITPHSKMITFCIINPRRACAARVTVLCLCVSQSVCVCV